MCYTHHQCTLFMVRYFSRVSPPPPACGESVVRVSNNIAHLGLPKDGPKPRQLLTLSPFPPHSEPDSHVTAISWIKYYLDEILGSVIQSHFNKGLVQMCLHADESSIEKQGQAKP